MVVLAMPEASDVGVPVYRRLGFEKVDSDANGTKRSEGKPALFIIRWPKGTPQSTRKLRCQDNILDHGNASDVAHKSKIEALAKSIALALCWVAFCK